MENRYESANTNEKTTSKRKKRQPLNSFDWPFLVILLVILVIGLVMMFSASYAYADAYYNDSFKFIKRQAGFAVLGLVFMYVVSRFDYHLLRKFSWVAYVGSVILLAILLIMPAMETETGTKRWIIVGPLNLQPSEVAKFAVILLFAHLIAKNYKQMEKPLFSMGILGVLLAIVCGLVIAEPHLSATMLIFFIGVVMIIVGGIKMRYVAIAAGASAALLGIGLSVVGYATDRIKYWRNPWLDATGEGYQTIQSLLSIGSGGLFGRGIGQSRQKYLWVPEPHNDFIFSIVCEELGLIGAMVIIALFCLLVWRGFVVAMRSPDKFGSLLAMGLTFQVGLQAALNILVVTNTIPNTGISLPFFSYGGSSLVILLCEMGVVLSISRQANIERK